MEGKILVTTEALRSTASEFQGAMTQIQNYTSLMLDQANGLSAKFQGEAAQAYINKFNMLQDDITRLANMVNEHVTDLNEMADVYDRTEGGNVEKTQKLKGPELEAAL